MMQGGRCISSVKTGQSKTVPTQARKVGQAKTGHDRARQKPTQTKTTQAGWMTSPVSPHRGWRAPATDSCCWWRTPRRPGGGGWIRWCWGDRSGAATPPDTGPRARASTSRSLPSSSPWRGRSPFTTCLQGEATLDNQGSACPTGLAVDRTEKWRVVQLANYRVVHVFEWQTAISQSARAHDLVS